MSHLYNLLITVLVVSWVVCTYLSHRHVQNITKINEVCIPTCVRMKLPFLAENR